MLNFIELSEELFSSLTDFLYFFFPISPIPAFILICFFLLTLGLVYSSFSGFLRWWLRSPI